MMEYFRLEVIASKLRSHLIWRNFYFVEETASNLVRFQYQEGGGVFEDRSSGKGDEQDG